MFFSIGGRKDSRPQMWYPGQVAGSVTSLLWHLWSILPPKEQNPAGLRMLAHERLGVAFIGLRSRMKAGVNVFDTARHLLLTEDRFPENPSKEEYIERAIQEAVWSCWQLLPPQQRNIDDIESHIKRLVERHLSNFEDDWKTFSS